MSNFSFTISLLLMCIISVLKSLVQEMFNNHKEFKINQGYGYFEQQENP